MKRLLLSLIVIALFAVGCDNDDVTINPPLVLLPDTPTNVAYFLELSFNYRDINLYKQCLSPGFTFHFNPADVGTEVDGYVIPETWSYEEDWRATQNMFTRAYDIAFQIDEAGIGSPAEGDTNYTAENIAVSLTVMIDENNGLLGQGTGDFTFETYDSNGDTYWRITDWWDGSTNKGGEGFSTIGLIKAYFKNGKPN